MLPANEGFKEALIELEKEERKGKQATIDLAEYEHWGDYDGLAPDADDDDPHHHGLTKEARHAAAVAATEEAIREHQQRERTSATVGTREARRHGVRPCCGCSQRVASACGRRLGYRAPRNGSSHR